MRNLDAHNRCGLIVSWAALNQGGSGHINTHDPRYMRSLLEDLGYVYDDAWSAILQRGLRTAGLREAQNVDDAFDADTHAPCHASLTTKPSISFYPAMGCTILVMRKRNAPCSAETVDAAAATYARRQSSHAEQVDASTLSHREAAMLRGPVAARHHVAVEALSLRG